jgi:hypothetical protein
MFDWAQYLRLGKDLAVSTSDDASLRSAVSRAYYSLYNRCRLILAREGNWPNPVPDPHRFAWDKLERNPSGRPNGRNRKTIANVGRRLRENRNHADYDDLITNLTAMVQDTLADADDVEPLLNTL